MLHWQSEDIHYTSRYKQLTFKKYKSLVSTELIHFQIDVKTSPRVSNLVSIKSGGVMTEQLTCL